MDVVLRGGQLVDGTGVPARRADVGIEGGRIAAVGDVAANGAQEVDLAGLVLAPGFVDIHTHYDAQVLWDRDLTPSCWHGVTTVVMGNCGFGIAPTRPEHRSLIARTLENVEGMSVEALEAGIPWTFETFPEYLDRLDAAPTRLNVGAMIGHTPLRLYVLGDDAVEREATDDEVARMQGIVAEAMAVGAVGFATSKSPTHTGAGGKPVPSRLADTGEVFRIVEALRDAGRGVVQITPGAGLFLKEFAAISQSTGRHVSWTALLTGIGGPGTALHLALEEGLDTRFRIVLANDDEEELATLLQDERAVLGLSDAGAHASQLCDACFSTHLLSHWTRDKGVLSWEQAVWRLTGQPAQVFGIADRGLIREGLAADLVAFDPDTVGVQELERVWDLPAGADRLIARSTGVEHVWVNGTPIRQNGEDVADARPGKLLRGGRAS